MDTRGRVLPDLYLAFANLEQQIALFQDLRSARHSMFENTNLVSMNGKGDEDLVMAAMDQRSS